MGYNGSWPPNTDLAKMTDFTLLVIYKKANLKPQEAASSTMINTDFKRLTKDSTTKQQPSPTIIAAK
jgi:hypothetical protein